MGNSKVECKRHSGVLLVGDLASEKTRILKYARCKMWDCQYCARVNAGMHRSRIISGVNKIYAEETWRFSFVTLTSHEKNRGLERSIEVWKDAWKLLSNRMRHTLRKINHEVYYVFIGEQHKDGTLHVHGLFPNALSKKWWKDNARGCGLGYEVDCEEVENSGWAAAYCTKYMSKHIGVSIYPKNFRRINFSRNFPALKKNAVDGDWQKAEHWLSIERLIIEGWRDGREVNLFGEIFTEFIDNIEENDVVKLEGLASEKTRLREEKYQLDGIYTPNSEQQKRKLEIKKRLVRIERKIRELLPDMFEGMGI